MLDELFLYVLTINSFLYIKHTTAYASHRSSTVITELMNETTIVITRGGGGTFLLKSATDHSLPTWKTSPGGNTGSKNSLIP